MRISSVERNAYALLLKKKDLKCTQELQIQATDQ